MNRQTTATRPDALWQSDEQPEVSWRCWDGEIVIYDDRSGDTMKLDIIMSEIFRLVLQRPATGSAITSHLAATFDLPADARLRRITDRALRRLREAALIRPLSSSSGSEPA